jgi:Tfp pilus assembly protein PilN
MRQINLLPPEIGERRRVREITLLIGAAGLALLGLLIVVFLVQTARIAGERDHLAEAKRANAALQRQVNELQAFVQIQQTVQTKAQLLTQLTQNEVRWSVLLNDVSLVIPTDVWLTTFTGTVQVSGGTGNQPVTSVGNISMAGSTFSHLDVAKWLSRLSMVREFTFPYLTLSAKGGEGATEIVTFNSSVNLSTAALRRNEPGGERSP